jgi:hypothetical protein
MCAISCEKLRAFFSENVRRYTNAELGKYRRMNTKIGRKAARIGSTVTLSLALCAGAFVSSGSPALARDAPAAQQDQGMGPMGNSAPLTGPLPEAWDAAWDSGTYDHRHYIIGTVASFSAYRLSIAAGTGNDETMQIDLKKGTVIRPTGLNLAPGEHVAVIGYWSKGTFIANRVVLRRA